MGIVPGFVNAHTHLELGPLGKPGCDEENEVSWLRHVVDQRRTGTEQALRATVDGNVKASIDAGTTFLADITTAGLSWESVAAAPLRAVVFAELIGHEA